MRGAALRCTRTSRGWNSTWTPASGVYYLHVLAGSQFLKDVLSWPDHFQLCLQCLEAAQYCNRHMEGKLSSVGAHLRCRDAATTEHHAASLDAQHAELHQQAAAAQQRAEQAEAQLAEQRLAHEALQQEFGLMADDLTVMVRENQVCWWSIWTISVMPYVVRNPIMMVPRLLLRPACRLEGRTQACPWHQLHMTKDFQVQKLDNTRALRRQPRP
jgi:hypothetical protein